MLQQDPYFLFSRPIAYFGSFQQLEEECEIDQESSSWNISVPLGIQINTTHPTHQTTGVYLHWFDA